MCTSPSAPDSVEPHEGAVLHHPHHGRRLDRPDLGPLERIGLGTSEGQADPTFGSHDVEHLHLDLVAHRHHVADLVEAMPTQLGTMDQPTKATQVDHRAIVGDGGDRSLHPGPRGQVGEHLSLVLATLPSEQVAS